MIFTHVGYGMVMNGKYPLLCGNVTSIPWPSPSCKSAKRIPAPSIVRGRIVEWMGAADVPYDFFSIKLTSMFYRAYRLRLNVGG